MYVSTLEFLKGATKELREEWMEGNLKGDYLRFLTLYQVALNLKSSIAM
jgi:hypothetical protein